MPVLKSKQTQEIEIIDGFTCNKCGKTHTDVYEMQEMFRHKIAGGFGSVWGDGSVYDIVLCQHCAHELLQSYAEPIDLPFWFDE